MQRRDFLALTGLTAGGLIVPSFFGKVIAAEQLQSALDPALKKRLADAALQAHGLDVCLEELEPQRRTLIRTAFFEGCTYEELATRSQTPLGTVKSWIRRSLAKLKACLER